MIQHKIGIVKPFFTNLKPRRGGVGNMILLKQSRNELEERRRLN